MSGIERCILRLGRLEAFECYVETLTTAHVVQYGIAAEHMVIALREFEMVLCTFLQHIQLHHDLDLVINTWQRFFDLLCNAVQATNSQILIQQQEEQQDREEEQQRLQRNESMEAK